MQTKTAVAPSPAAIALAILEHGDWRQRGLAHDAMSAPGHRPEQAIFDTRIPRPRRDDGRFRSTRGDLAFAAA